MFSYQIMKQIKWPTIDSKHLIVESKQMSALENEMFSSGLPKEALMEKAGIQLSRWFLKRKSFLKDGIIIIIGPGNNGGDGAVIARELFLKGFEVKIWCPFSLKKTLTINLVNYLTSIGVQKLIEPPNPTEPGLWIDAVLGNNQRSKVDYELIKIFERKFNTRLGNIVSLDIPTGLCPDTGKPFLNKAIQAHYTLVIGLYKIGLLQDSALPYVGKLHYIDIGIPKGHLNKLETKVLKITFKDIKTIDFPSTPRNSDKYKRGKTLLITGSDKYPGAAVLALKGALSSGAGFVSAILPEMVAKSIWQVSPEIVVKGTLRSNENGNAILFNALKDIDLTSYDSVVVGPGIGIDNDDWQKTQDFFKQFPGLLILDADALNRISKSKLNKKFFTERESKTWITPHISEFMRLFPYSKGNNRIESVLNAAKENDIDILLKGAHSIIANNSKAWQLYGTDPATARAGLGDLLSGFIAGCSAIEIACSKNISTESFAKYVLFHSFAASKCKKGSNALLIGNKLSKLMRKAKARQIS